MTEGPDGQLNELLAQAGFGHWAQRRNRQPVLELITPGRAVASGYMEWIYENEKPFIMTPEARARVLRAPRLERPRQQRGPRSTGASTGVDNRLEDRLLPQDKD
ncbi:hypothetical protein V6N13_103662 [Hibiscus sabdariffa]